MTDCPDARLGDWSARPAHRAWLAARADALFDLFGQRTINRRGGFRQLDRTGAPIVDPAAAQPIHLTARAAHCYAIGALLGRPGAPEMVDHAMRPCGSATATGRAAGISGPSTKTARSTR